MGKFEHGFGTQLGAVLLWQRVRSGGLMLAAWSYQTTAAVQETKKQKKIDFFQEFRRGVRQFLWISLSTVSARN